MNKLMTLQEFFNRFGTNTTNNFQLLNYAKLLGIKNVYYVMRDEVKDLPKDKKFLNVLTNIHTSEEPGVHHNCFYIGEKGVYFFDSYGLKPTKEIMKFLKNGEDSSFIIQTGNTRYCGQLSLYFLYLMNKTEKSFYDIVLQIVDEINKITL